MSKIIDVAVAVLIDANNQVLLAERPVGKHMAGFWEFPGGKFEPGESVEQALHRELEEELGIRAGESEPLITLVHHYPERSVRLHVRVVRQWLGKPQSLDQQALRWVSPSQLSAANLLPADTPIVNAIVLPASYAISPYCDEKMPWSELDQKLDHWQQQGLKLIQWRQTAFATGSAPSHAAQAQATRVADWAQSSGITALLNCPPATEQEQSWAARLGFDGIHLNARHVAGSRADKTLKQLADEEGLSWVAASCHSAQEIAAAKQQACDFAVLGAVKPTLSHPDELSMGWVGFAIEASEGGLPAYALGGCRQTDIQQAKQSGAQGIAAIREFWSLEAKTS